MLEEVRKKGRIAHRGQALHLRVTGAAEDLGGAFMPSAAPFGWAAVVRPDRTVLHDGPATEADRLVRESLSLLGAPSPAAAHAFQLIVQFLDASIYSAAVCFQLRFARSARADAAAQLRHRLAPSGKPRQHVLKLRQLHL